MNLLILQGVVNATPYQYIELLVYTLIITIISQLFNKKYGLTMSQQLKMQEQVRTLQQRMSDAQRNANPEELRRIQQEMMQISKDMMMKTMLPSLVRCAFFWIVYAILNYYYKNVSFNGLSFFWIYFLYSLGIGLIFWLITKKFGKKDKEKEDELLLEQEYNKHMKGSIDFSGLKPEIIEEIMETKRSLEEKKKRGELATDIDIDAEIQRMINENL
ncbi:MAG: EMC3/TMCO1 family protein, partial [Promethearchaeota archaeon]